MEKYCLQDTKILPSLLFEEGNIQPCIIFTCLLFHKVPNHLKNFIAQHFYRRDFCVFIYDNFKHFMECFNELRNKYPKLIRFIKRRKRFVNKRMPMNENLILLQEKCLNPMELRAILCNDVFRFKISPEFWTPRDSLCILFPKGFGLRRTVSQVSKSLKDGHVSQITGRENQHLRTRRRVQENEKPPVRVKVRFKLEKTVLTKEINADFSRHLKSQLAKRMRVPLPSIKDLEIASGTDVSFTLTSFNDEHNLMDDQTVVEAADFLRNEIKQQRFHLTDLKGQILLTTSGTYVSSDDNPSNISFVLLMVLGITIIMVVVLIIVLVYLAKRFTRMPRTPDDCDRAYRRMDYGRDSSQSIGKYSLDSGLWLGPGPEPAFTVPDAPYYRPPTADQIASTPRPVTSVRTRLKTNWNVDERALSTIPNDHGRSYATREEDFS